MLLEGRSSVLRIQEEPATTVGKMQVLLLRGAINSIVDLDLFIEAHILASSAGIHIRLVSDTYARFYNNPVNAYLVQCPI
jgi:hypothetical protein